MKKFFVFSLAFFLVASVFFMTAFAEETPGDIALSVSGIKTDGTAVKIDDHTEFASGWDETMKLASDRAYMSDSGFVRIVIELCKDWKGEGFFGAGDNGFKYGAIYFPENVKVTLNMNGFTADRNCTAYDGAVIYVDENADVIISDGTLTGGRSYNGAGGIHICDDANVTLNNVNVVGNEATDDDGGGIAVYNGATLTMSGGSVSDNVTKSVGGTCRGGGIYTEDCAVTLNNVTLRNNQSVNAQGSALYAKNSDVTMNNCAVAGNGTRSIIYIDKKSALTAKETEFTENGAQAQGDTYSDVIIDMSGDCYLEGCSFSDNNCVYLIKSDGAQLKAVDTVFENNNSAVFLGKCKEGGNSSFTDCIFSNNSTDLKTFEFTDIPLNLSFVDCKLGDATFENKEYAEFLNSKAGSVFAEGSLTTIVSFVALIASGASIMVNVESNKKKAVIDEE